MAICTKINTAGTTLQNNLNARGVSCTYGKNSDGKDTIKDMADLITSSNLKGSADSLISITANRPYLLSGETTDLTVRLVNGLGQPLANKSVSISDGSSLYSGITNNNGLFILYDVEVSADTTFTATYSSVSDSVVVEYCAFVDYAVTNNKNTNWQNYSSRLTVTTDENGTNLVKGSANGYYLVNNASNDFEDYICEFDIVETSGYVNWFVESSSNQIVFTFITYGLTSGKHVKIHSEDGVLNVYVDGVKKTNDITITPPAPYHIGFRIPSGSTPSNLKFKNFRIRAL